MPLHPHYSLFGFRILILFTPSFVFLCLLRGISALNRATWVGPLALGLYGTRTTGTTDLLTEDPLSRPRHRPGISSRFDEIELVIRAPRWGN